MAASIGVARFVACTGEDPTPVAPIVFFGPDGSANGTSSGGTSSSSGDADANPVDAGEDAGPPPPPLDPTFGDGGSVSIRRADLARPRVVAVVGDGTDIVIAGSRAGADAGAGLDYPVLVRLHRDGAVDEQFGANGVSHVLEDENATTPGPSVPVAVLPRPGNGYVVLGAKSGSSYAFSVDAAGRPQTDYVAVTGVLGDFASATGVGFGTVKGGDAGDADVLGTFRAGYEGSGAFLRPTPVRDGDVPSVAPYRIAPQGGKHLVAFTDSVGVKLLRVVPDSPSNEVEVVDPTFGSKPAYVIDQTYATDVRGISVRDDGLVILCTVKANAAMAVVTSLNAAGESFSGHAIDVIPQRCFHDRKGRLVVIGQHATSQTFAIYRGMKDRLSTPDETFGPGGILTLPLDGDATSSVANAAFTASDGSIVVVGTRSKGTPDGIVVARLSP